MHIGTPTIEATAGAVIWRVPVRSSRGPDTLWFRVDGESAAFVAESSDAALLALLVPAMAGEEEIVVDGFVSARLARNAGRTLQSVLKTVMPRLGRVGIRADRLQTEPGTRGTAVAAGFSGGIDSFCLLADHHYADPLPGFRLTHLLFNNVGAHGAGEAGSRLFEARHARVATTAAAIGLPLVRVDSNLDAFYGPDLDFSQTHTLRNAAVALLLQRGIGRFLYASSFSLADAFVGPADMIAYSDAVVVPLLGTDRLDALSAGGEYTRVEKTLRVASIPASYGALDVCTDPHVAGNCSACWKCLRTLLTLEIAGMLDRYAGAFDLDVYRGKRARYLRHVLASDYPLLREVARFAGERGYPIGAGVRAKAFADRLLRGFRPAVNAH